MSNRYNKPELGTDDWHIPLNENFRKMESDIEIRASQDQLSEYTPNSGAKFLATDTGQVFIGDGSSWNKIGRIIDNDGIIVSSITELKDRLNNIDTSHNQSIHGGERIILDFGIHKPEGDELPLIIPEGTVICGMGGKSTFVDMSGISKPFLRGDYPDPPQEVHVKVSDIAIVGDGTKDSKAVHLNNAHSWRISNVIARDLDVAIDAVGSWNGYIDNCLLTDSSTRNLDLRGSFGDATNAICVNGSRFFFSRNEGVRVRRQYGASFFGCSFEGNNGPGLLTDEANTTSILGGYFESNGDPDILIGNGGFQNGMAIIGTLFDGGYTSIKTTEPTRALFVAACDGLRGGIEKGPGLINSVFIANNETQYYSTSQPRIYVQQSAPSNPNEGDLWVDTS